MVEAGQLPAARGGLDSEPELGDLDALGVEINPVEVVLEKLPVEIKPGALTAEFIQPSVGESDVQAGVAFVNRLEQAADVLPDGRRVVWIAVFEGVLERFGGQQN